MKNELPVLSRLGPVPFWRGGAKCLESLSRIYRRASEKAAARLASCGKTNSRRGV